MSMTIGALVISLAGFASLPSAQEREPNPAQKLPTSEGSSRVAGGDEEQKVNEETNRPVALTSEEGKDLVQSTCTVCHTLDLTLSSRHSADEWEGLVKRMVEFGADLDDRKQKTVIDYLAKKYPVSTTSEEARSPTEQSVPQSQEK